MDDLTLKLVLGIVVIVCCACAGRALARVDSRRAALLAETMDSMQLLRIHMLDGLMPMQPALEKASGRILGGTAMHIGMGGALEAWSELKKSCALRGGFLDCLNGADMDTLDRFFEKLGLTAAEEQRQNFETAIRELGALENACRGEGERKNRLYTTLGALAGAAIVIALF